MSHQPFHRVPLGEEIYFTTIPAAQFKTNLLGIHLVLPLTRETISGCALVPLILEQGTADYPTFQSFSKKLGQMYGAAAGSTVTKQGDRLVVSLHLSALDDSFALEGEPLLAESAKLLCDMLLRPVLKGGAFDDTTFAIQQKYLLDAIEAEINDKRRYALQEMVRLLFGDEPAGLSKLGYVEDIRAMTPASAADTWRWMLDTARIEIIHVGRGDAAPARKIFRDRMAPLIRHPGVLPETNIHQGSGPVKTGESRFDVVQAKLCLGFRSEVGPKSPMLDAMRMMTAVLGGTPTSKLFLNVREKMSLCYYCAANFDRTKGVLMIDSGVEPDQVEEAKAAILDQLRQMQEGDFTETDLTHARLSVLNTFRSMTESPYITGAYYLGQILDGTALTPEDQCRRLEAVTAEQVAQAAGMLRLDTVYLLTREEK